MATPESLVEAACRGMVSALLAHNEPSAKPAKPKVIKKDDVVEAVRQTLPQIIAEMEAQVPPQQQDLFAVPGLDEEDQLGQQRRFEEAVARAAEREHDNGELPDDYYDPNAPGSKLWTAPGPS